MSEVKLFLFFIEAVPHLHVRKCLAVEVLPTKA